MTDLYYPSSSISFGELVELFMQMRGIDRKRLSDEASVAQKQIDRIIKNEVGIPRHVLRIMDELGLCIREKPV